MNCSLWLDRGTGLDPVKAKIHQITCAIEDVRDATKESVAYNAFQTGGGGVYAVVGKGAGWPEVPLDPVPAADWVEKQLQRCDLGKPNAPTVHLNYEGDDPTWINAFLLRYRAHRPLRQTLWTMQAHKAAIYHGSTVTKTLVAKNIAVGPQCYVGDENERVESGNEIAAWAANGIPVPMIQPFLFATDLGGWWGEAVPMTAYIQGRLP